MFKTFKPLYTFFGLFCLINNCYSENKSMLLQNIFKDYNNQASPQKYNDPLHLSLGLALRAFKHIDQMEGTIAANIWLRYQWNDPRLSWDIDKYNYSFISLNTNPEYDYTIWTPDIYLYNTAENPLSEIDYSRAIIQNNGDILWSRPGIITSTCSFDLTHFPYDRQNCYMKFGSWSYDGNQLDLHVLESDFDISNYIEHEEWILSNYYSEKNIEYYNCCPEPYPDIKFFYTITRRSGYYDLNIVLPTFATASLVLLTLLVPWSSGERISFAVTVMLSIIVFLLILSDNLPKSDQKPLLSRMIIGLTLFSLLGVFFTILISALSDYNEKFKKDENTTTNRMILKLHKFFKSFEICKKQTNYDIENNTQNNVIENNTQNNVIENNTQNISEEQEFETTINVLNDHNVDVSSDHKVEKSPKNSVSKLNDSNLNTLDMNNIIRTSSYRESVRKRSNILVNTNENQQNETILDNNTNNNADNTNNNTNNNTDNVTESEKTIKKECEKMINYFEHIYMIVFFVAFIVYCIIMFSIIPQYE